MNIVYLLRSQKNPDRVYVGLCGNMKNRLAEHNAGECKTTAEIFRGKLMSQFTSATKRKPTRLSGILRPALGEHFQSVIYKHSIAA